MAPRFPRPDRQVAPLTARHFFLLGQEKVTKKKATPASGPSLREGFPHSIAIAGARCEGPSMAHHSSHGIHAASTPSMTITRGLLTGLSVRVAYDF